jgi:16S rRNA (cytidine1402-2'-O)-methyltransferase
MGLYLVATPIGNMGDISARARETLENAVLVASEDTRRTGLLLQRLGLSKPQVSFHEHNEEQAGRRIIGVLREGKDVALVTDAGTPGIADPGFTLVRAAIAEGIAVTMVPGPCALVMGLVLSGLPSHSFLFKGFPPRAGGPRRRFLAAEAALPHTLIFYESPHRLARFLRDACEVLGDRPAAVCVEMTKKFEEIRRGTLADLAPLYAKAPPRGEVTVVIGGAPLEVPSG